jgi:hypothetical protein
LTAHQVRPIFAYMSHSRLRLISGRGGNRSPRQKPRLLDQVREAIRARHYSRRTEEAYVGWIKRFILFHGKRHRVGYFFMGLGVFLLLLAYRVAG